MEEGDQNVGAREGTMLGVGEVKFLACRVYTCHKVEPKEQRVLPPSRAVASMQRADGPKRGKRGNAEQTLHGLL